MSEDERLQALVRRIVGGDLQGRAAFDEVVAVIARSEIPKGATPQEVARIREQVALGVSHDRELCELLYGDATPTKRSRETVHEEPPPAELVDTPLERPEPARPIRPTKSPTKSTAAKKKRARAKAGRPSGRSRIPARGDDELVAEVPRRSLAWGLGAGGAVVLALVVYLVWPRPACERLAELVCAELPESKLGPCLTAGVRATLKIEEAPASACEAAIAAGNEAITGKAGNDRIAAYRTAVTEALGFDPRGKDVAAAERVRVVAPPEPVAVVSGQPGIASLFVDEAFLYWTTPAGVFRARSIGGGVESLGTQVNASAITATTDAIYWLEREPKGGQLWFDKKRGEYDPVPLPLEDVKPEHAAFLGPEVAFVDADSGGVLIAAVAGGAPRSLAPPSMPHPLRIVGDATNVFWAIPQPLAQVWSATRSGGSPIKLAEGVSDPRALALGPDAVFVVDGARGAILRIPKAGGEAQTIVTGHPAASELAVDRDHVYWTEPEPGLVLAAPLAGGEPRVLAKGLVTPRFIVVDGAAVYWESQGVITRLPK